MKKFLLRLSVLVVLLSCFLSIGVSVAFDKDEQKQKDGVVSLDDKTIFVVGNSMVYYGNCVAFGERGKNDYGYFYQLIRSNNENANVIDFTYSGHTLKMIYDKYLSKLSQDKLSKADYVVLSEGTLGNENLISDCENIMNLFPDSTKFFYMCHSTMYENNTESLLNGVAELRSRGIPIVNWGELVYDVFSGNKQVPGATLQYDRCSFIKDNHGFINDATSVEGNIIGDSKHPNPLSGYIAAQMLYTAITQRSALYADYSFCGDSSIHEYFDLDNFVKSHYNGDYTTNFVEIFDSPMDMHGLQRLINEYNEAEGRHCYEIERGVEASCGAAGLSEGCYCTVCNKVVSTQRFIPSNGGHQIIYDEAVPATCTKSGKTAGAHCGVCKEVLVEPKIIEVGHNIRETLYPATVNSDGRKVGFCVDCNELVINEVIPRVESIELSVSVYEYDGKEKSPSAIVKDRTGKALTKNVDYVVQADTNRIMPGKYNAKVLLAGKYSGSHDLTITILPAKVSSVTVTQSASAIKLSWNEVPGALGYRVYQYNPTTKNYKKLGTVKKLNATMNNLKAGTQYSYLVRPYTQASDGTVLWANYDTKDIIHTATKPLAPALKASGGVDKFTLSWSSCAGATGYEVWYSTSKNGTYKKLGSTAKTSCTKSCTGGKVYYFKVRAYIEVGGKKVYGAASGEKGILVL